MVDLLTADPSLSISEVARSAIGGSLPKHKLESEVERLRKKYRTMRDSNRLPQGGEVARVQRIAAGIENTYDQRIALHKRAEELLPEAEAKVQSEGLNPHLQGLALVLSSLQAEHRGLEDLTNDEPDWIAYRAMELGLNKEEAVARYREAIAKKQKLERQIKVLRELRDLRRAAKLPF